MPTHDLLTTGEVAAALRVTESTVARWARSGRLSVVRLPGGTFRFRRSDVERLLAGDEHEAGVGA